MTSSTAGKLGCPVLTEESQHEGGGLAAWAGTPPCHDIRVSRAALTGPSSPTTMALTCRR